MQATAKEPAIVGVGTAIVGFILVAITTIFGACYTPGVIANPRLENVLALIIGWLLIIATLAIYIRAMIADRQSSPK